MQESLVIERKGLITALIYPDYESVGKAGLSEAQLLETLEQHKKELNARLPSFMNIARLKIVPEEFEKTPKKSIKRFLYTFDE